MAFISADGKRYVPPVKTTTKNKTTAKPPLGYSPTTDPTLIGNPTTYTPPPSPVAPPYGYSPVTDPTLPYNPPDPASHGQYTPPPEATYVPPATTTTTTPPPSTTTAPGIQENTAMQIIDAALQIVGLDPSQLSTSGSDVGQTLSQYFWQQITSQGLTDPTSIGDMVNTMLPATGQFKVAFPGYDEALKNGYIRNVSQYVSAEEGITAVMLQGGIPKDMINPTTVGNLISNGVSTNEVSQRVQQGYDAVQNAPAEVQNYFGQEFGAQGAQALATVFLNPNIDAVTLQKMLAGAQVRGAAAASNLTVSQGLSQRLADMGQTYASAQAKFQSLTSQAGLFQQTVGEHQSQAPVPGTQNANQPLDISNQGVAAAFGTDSNAVQQVHQAALARQNEFRGTGGASSTQAEGYSGLSSAKAF